MKRLLEGWLARDEKGSLFVAQNKPNNDCGYWCNMGEFMQLKDSDFPEVTFDNSPVKVSITIEDDKFNCKQAVLVDRPFSPAIGSLPCVVGCEKVYNGIAYDFVYIVKINGTTTLARKGDVIAQLENGEWCVIS